MASITHGLTFDIDTVQAGYAGICRDVRNYGDEVSPRGEKTKEILNPTIILRNPHDALPVGIGRGATKLVAAVEAVQLCGAFSDAKMTAGLSEFYARLREPNTGEYHGAYGARIKDQALHVVEKLKRDPDSRQAIVTLWDPYYDNQPGKLDYPCTVSLQFYIRQNQLHCTSTMRSNDVWFGLAYDLFQFGQLQWTIANELDLRAGDLVHRPMSLHIYERDWEKVDGLYEASSPAPNLYGFTTVAHARLIGRRGGHMLAAPTPTEQWYMAVLDPLMNKLGRR